MEADSDGFIHSPPDTHAAVGLDRLVEVTNGHVAIYNKAGSIIAGGDTGGGAVDLDAFCGSEGCFDPKVIYDQYAGRFVAVALSGKNSVDSTLHVMVSKTSSPGNLSADWDRFALPAGATIGGTDGWFDYPGLGVSPAAVVVTGNIFANPPLPPLPFLGVRVRIFDKQDLYNGDANLSYQDLDRNVAEGGFTMQPAHHFGQPPTGTFYLLQRWNANNLRVVALTGLPGAASFSASVIGTSNQGACVPSAPQMNTTVRIDTVCPRMMNSVWRAGSLWGTLTGSDAGNSRAIVQWFELATNGYPSGVPSLVQHGVVDGGSGEFTFMPAITVDACGNASLTYTQSSSNRFPEMRYTGRRPADPPGGIDPPVVVITSPGYYDDFTTGSADRWGDYSAAVIDPVDGSFWVANEYVETVALADNTGRWGTWHANFSYGCLGPDPTATVTPGPSATPSPSATPGSTPSATPTLAPMRLPILLHNLKPGLSNGGFESGPSDWQEFSSNAFDLILPQEELPIPPHSGVWAAWLGGADNEESVLQQRLVVPGDRPILTFWHWIGSQEIVCGQDRGEVFVDTGRVDHFDLCIDTRTNGWVQRSLDLNLSRGHPILLKFRVVTDGSLNSNLFLDDVAFVPQP